MQTLPIRHLGSDSYVYSGFQAIRHTVTMLTTIRYCDYFILAVESIHV
jgi:hypothetical protein